MSGAESSRCDCDLERFISSLPSSFHSLPLDHQDMSNFSPTMPLYDAIFCLEAEIMDCNYGPNKSPSFKSHVLDIVCQEQGK